MQIYFHISYMNYRVQGLIIFGSKQHSTLATQTDAEPSADTMLTTKLKENA